ncbi:hypothetical protein O5269_26445, partial [Escherichia coli]|nr:hypothetical protein [Escherichia coli]
VARFSATGIYLLCPGQDYIKHQLEVDKMGEQLSIPYPGSPFTGRK